MSFQQNLQSGSSFTTGEMVADVDLSFNPLFPLPTMDLKYNLIKNERLTGTKGLSNIVEEPFDYVPSFSFSCGIAFGIKPQIQFSVFGE